MCMKPLASSLGCNKHSTKNSYDNNHDNDHKIKVLLGRFLKLKGSDLTQVLWPIALNAPVPLILCFFKEFVKK